MNHWEFPVVLNGVPVHFTSTYIQPVAIMGPVLFFRGPAPYDFYKFSLVPHSSQPWVGSISVGLGMGCSLWATIA